MKTTNQNRKLLQLINNIILRVRFFFIESFVCVFVVFVECSEERMDLKEIVFFVMVWTAAAAAVLAKRR